MPRKSFLYLFLLLSPLAFCKWTFDYTIFKLVLPQIFFLLITLTYLFERKNFKYHKPLTIILLLYLLSNAISAIINPFHYATSARMMELAAYFSIFLITVNLGKDKKTLFFLFISGALLSIWAISDFVKFSLVNAGFGNKNFFAGYIIFFIPLSLNLAINRKNRKNKIILSFLFLLYSFALLLTKSEAAYLAATISILFLLGINSSSRQKGLIKILFILFLLFFALVFSDFYFIERVVEDVRPLIWGGTIKMINAHPLIGWGPGSFAIHYHVFRLPEYFLQEAIAPITAHAHCEYLEILSETGIIGILLFLSFFFLLFKKTFKVLYKKGTEEKAIITGLTAGILAVLIDNIFSTNLRQSFTPILLFFAMGLTVCYLEPSLPKFNKKCSFSIFLLILLSLSIASFNTIKKDVVAGFYLKKSHEARLQKDFPKAIHYYKKTISINPFSLAAYYKLAFIYGALKKYDLALSTYEKLYSISPHYAQIDKNMAVLYYEKNDLDASLYYFRETEKLNPYDTDTLCSIASIYLREKEFHKGKPYLERVLYIDPKNSYALRCLKDIEEKRVDTGKLQLYNSQK